MRVERVNDERTQDRYRKEEDKGLAVPALSEH